MFNLLKKSVDMVTALDALPGRDDAIPTAETHFVFDRPLTMDVPDGAGS